jgi:hypothetical protein
VPNLVCPDKSGVNLSELCYGNRGTMSFLESTSSLVIHLSCGSVSRYGRQRVGGGVISSISMKATPPDSHLVFSQAKYSLNGSLKC